MFEQPEDWLPESLDAAKVELQRRGVDPGAIRVGPPPLPEGQPLFFAVSPVKLAIMATVTFGLYELYWFYKNWKLVKQRTKNNIMPFWRAFFGIIWCYPFFGEVGDAIKSRGLSFPTSPGFLAAGWIILSLMWRLPNPYWLVSFLAPLALVPVQNTINQLNAAVAPDHDPNSRFSGWNIAGIVIGGIFFVIAFFGAFLPQ